MNIYNLRIRLTNGHIEPLEFTGQMPSTVAAAAIRRVEVDPLKRVEAVAVLLPGQPAMVYLPTYEDFWHLLPDHVRRVVTEPDFGIETHQPESKPLQPPAVKDTLL